MSEPETADREKHLKWFERRFIINPSVQFVFIAYAISIAFLFLSFGGLLTVFVQRIAAVQMMGFDAWNWLDLFLIILMVIVILVAIFVGFIISNRVAGPIYRLSKHLEEVAAGKKVGPIHFRKADHFKEIVDNYNKVIARLEK